MANVQPFYLRARALRERSETIATAAKRELQLTEDLKSQIRMLKRDFLQLVADMDAADEEPEQADDVKTSLAFLEEMFGHFDDRLIAEHQATHKPTLQ